MTVNSFLIICLLVASLLTSFTISMPLIGIRDDASSEFIGVGVSGDVPPPINKRRVEKPSQSSFCSQNRDTYENYCNNMWTDRPTRLQTVLFSFCPGYENKCLH